MNMFKHESRQFKFDVLREVAIRGFEKRITPDIANEIAHLLVQKHDDKFRCCSYKERAIIRRRVRLALGQFPNLSFEESQNRRQIIRVVEPACDGCTIQNILITNNCRKCMAKSCQSACKFDAIVMGNNQAEIDQKKCVSCGACVKSCPFNAIVKTERPCRNACPVDAISYDPYGIAVINEDRCINCGSCLASCPFGAIEDLSWMSEVIKDIVDGEKVIAMFAPALQGQLDNTTLTQIKGSLIQTGFAKAYEVAIGADAVANAEHEELLEKMAKETPMTTSCCPAFLNMAKIHYPKIYENNMSTLVSPMIALARLLKAKYPDHKICFIGPCAAKKQEAQNEDSCVDYVLSFEEIIAMFVARRIYPSEVNYSDDHLASNPARGFAQGGGVFGAVLRAHEEKGYQTTVKGLYADGCKECKRNLLLMANNRLDINILEGMSCVGGCINGPLNIEDPIKAKARVALENQANKDVLIKDVLNQFDFSDIDLHRHK